MSDLSPLFSMFPKNAYDKLFQREDIKLFDGSEE